MRTFDVTIVGAGPAGIATALAAAESGAETLLIDEQPKTGGQLRWRVQLTATETGGFDLDPAPGPIFADHLADQLKQHSNITVETGTVAWGLFEDNVLGISTETAADEVQASAIVLATGSTDIALPFPGWTLPGVMTARAAQIFMHVHRVLPGRRWVILGSGEEADELALDLEAVGVEVVARCADAERIRASGTNRLSHVEIEDGVHEADALAIALGRQPDAELALHAKAACAFANGLGGFTVGRDQDGRTSEPGLYIAGDSAGIATLPELIAEGRLAGLAASGVSGERLDDARKQWDRVASERRRTAIDQLRSSIAAAS
jgi:thioredoxin reductase